MPNCLANSMASSMITFGGLVWENFSSQIAQRKIARSTRLILSIGHLGAFSVIMGSILGRREMMADESSDFGFCLPKW